MADVQHGSFRHILLPRPEHLPSRGGKLQKQKTARVQCPILRNAHDMGILKMDLIAPKEIHGDYHKIVGVPLTDSFWDVLQSSHAQGKFPETPCVAQLGRIWAPWLTSRCRFAGLGFGV